MPTCSQLVKGSRTAASLPSPPSPSIQAAAAASTSSLNASSEAEARSKALRKALAAQEAAKLLASNVHQQVLILGEGGSGAAMIAQLFARSDHYMLWREPHNWKFSAHMPDDMLGATCATAHASNFDPRLNLRGSCVQA